MARAALSERIFQWIARNRTPADIHDAEKHDWGALQEIAYEVKKLEEDFT